MQVRLLPEPAVALMAAGKVAGDILDALEDDLKAVLNNAGPTGTDVDREQTRRIDEHLHGVITSAAGNPKLSSIVLELRRLTQFFDLESLLERVTDTCNEHMEIIAALRMGDGNRAARAINSTSIRCVPALSPAFSEHERGIARPVFRQPVAQQFSGSLPVSITNCLATVGVLYWSYLLENDLCQMRDFFILATAQSCNPWRNLTTDSKAGG